MKKKHIFNITFITCIILGLTYFYYIGKNGHSNRRHVFYAVTDAALPVYIYERLSLVWFPISVWIADCVEEIWGYLFRKDHNIHHPFTSLFFAHVFYVYISIIIIKILQLYCCGEYLITIQGELEFYPPCTIKDAFFYVMHMSRIGRHICWIFDSFALSYLSLKWFRI